MPKSGELIFFCGVPGSRWSGVDTHLRIATNSDRTDETEDRIYFHKQADPAMAQNGHRGAYWGPGMGCGSDWTDLRKLSKGRIYYDISEVFTGNGPKVIKSHMFARDDNLEYIWETFKGDYIVLVYRDPIKSFDWWKSTMDFDQSWPSYKEMYTNDLSVMYRRIIMESNYIWQFADKHRMDWQIYKSARAFETLPNFDMSTLESHDLYKRHKDVFVSTIKIN